MAISIADAKKRIVVPGANPGDVFDIQAEADGKYTLVRVQRPPTTGPMSAAESMRAIKDAPLSPRLTWEELRTMTREP